MKHFSGWAFQKSYHMNLHHRAITLQDGRAEASRPRDIYGAWERRSIVSLQTNKQTTLFKEGNTTVAQRMNYGPLDPKSTIISIKMYCRIIKLVDRSMRIQAKN